MLNQAFDNSSYFNIWWHAFLLKAKCSGPRQSRTSDNVTCKAGLKATFQPLKSGSRQNLSWSGQIHTPAKLWMKNVQATVVDIETRTECAGWPRAVNELPDEDIEVAWSA